MGDSNSSCPCCFPIRLTCCFPIKEGALFFTSLCMILQLATCTIFLVFELWLAIVAVAVILLCQIYFRIVFLKKNPCLLRLFVAYEYLCIAAFTGLLMWSAALLSDPYGEKFMNPFLNFCVDKLPTLTYHDYMLLQTMNDCVTKVQIVSGCITALSLISVILQGYTGLILDKYTRSLQVSPQRKKFQSKVRNIICDEHDIPGVEKVRSVAAVSFNLTPEQRVRSGSVLSHYGEQKRSS